MASDQLPAPPLSALPGPLTDHLCWLLSTGGQRLTAELTTELEEIGLTPRAHAVLSAAMTGEHTQGELARAVGLDKTTMVVTIDELERRGLAERHPRPGDRRARVIAVTAAGRELAGRAEEVTHRLHADILGVLEPAERAPFLDALARIVSGRLATD